MDYLMHYGTPHEGSIPHSGRYPWGSGKEAYQRSGYSLSDYRLKLAEGWTEQQIAESYNITVKMLRQFRSINTDQERQLRIEEVEKLTNEGYNNVQIAKKMGLSGESEVRALKKQSLAKRYTVTQETANILKDQVAKKGFIDVGLGVEKELGISKDKLDTALRMLELDGYEIYSIKVKQATIPGQFTWFKVLAPEGTSWAEVANNPGKINSVAAYSKDRGASYQLLQPPSSMDSKRLAIRYAEEGGEQKDGVIEIRRGLKDINLGRSNYAQVRIAVDGTHYLKGMAVYSDDLPEGVDVLFNTNKSKGTPIKGSKDYTVLKPLKKDKDNPFGAAITAGGQSYYSDPDGKFIRLPSGTVVEAKKGLEGERVSLSPVNKLTEEGKWDTWSRNLSSQFLSKQPLSLINKQLGLAYAEKRAEFDEIKDLTNPAIKRKLLLSFAEDCDAAAVELKAAALPRQSSKVLLPVTSLKDNEVYAPTYKDGETVVLIRHPHEGIFQIPELKVNNRNREAHRVIGNSIDAIGINKTVADQLSGADFDGDSVIVIPTNDKVHIQTSKPLKELKDYDAKKEYPGYSGMKVMTSQQKGIEMGKISNLITDMTLLGAPMDEVARATRHSMCVIDAEKHELDYKKSEVDNGIPELKKKWQGGANRGASTIISRASAEAHVPEKKQWKSSNIDPITGQKIIEETGRTYEEGKYLKDENGNFIVDPNTGKKVWKTTGKIKLATETSTRMAEARTDEEVRALSSGTKKEEPYVQYALNMKHLGNEARKEFLNTPPLKMNPSAKKMYAPEVASLNAKLDVALLNAPKERIAQARASEIITRKMREDPQLDSDSLKKIRNQAIAQTRASVGAGKKDVEVEITDREWEAIQAGAISDTKLTKILNNTNQDKLKQRATPRNGIEPSQGKIAKIKAMYDSGHYTLQEIADQVGFSVSTVNKYIK